MPESREVLLLLKSASALRAQGNELAAQQLLEAATDLRKRAGRHAAESRPAPLADLDGIRKGPWQLTSESRDGIAAETPTPD